MLPSKQHARLIVAIEDCEAKLVKGSSIRRGELLIDFFTLDEAVYRRERNERTGSVLFEEVSRDELHLFLACMMAL